MTITQENFESKQRSFQKCVAAWSTLLAVFILYWFYFVLASSFGYGLEEFKIFEWLGGKALDNQDILLLIFIFLMSLVILVLGLWAVAWIVNRVDLSKGNKRFALEFLVYMLVTAATTAIAVSVGSYSGVFQSVPFVVFAIGAVFTESIAIIGLTLMLHATIYVLAVHFFWGLEAGDHTELLKFLASAFASYFCVFVPALLWREIGSCILWISKGFGFIKESVSVIDLLASSTAVEEERQKKKVEGASILRTENEDSAGPPTAT